MKQTREQWLNAAAAILIDEIIEPVTTIPTPPMRYSLTAPKVEGPTTILGECWNSEASTDGTFEIFITASLGDIDSAQVLAVLLHEQVHAFIGLEHGHGAPFQSLAKQVGLVGGPTRKSAASFTATIAGEQLAEQLADIIDTIGPIPHGRLNAALSGKPRQKNRQLLVTCTECDFKFRTSQKCLDMMTSHECLACGENSLIQQH